MYSYFFIIAFYTVLSLGYYFLIPKTTEGTMGATEIIAIIVAIIGLIGVIVTTHISENSKIKKFSEKLEQLSLDINKQFSDVDKDMGVDKNRVCLSQQHENLKGSFTNQNLTLLKAVNSYKEEKEDRMKKFSERQKNIQKTIDNVSDFFEDWQRANSALNSANERANQFEEKVKLQKSEIEKLKGQNAELSTSIKDLSQQNTELSTSIKNLSQQNTELNKKIEQLITELRQEKETQKNNIVKDNQEIQAENILIEFEENEAEQEDEWEP